MTVIVIIDASFHCSGLVYRGKVSVLFLVIAGLNMKNEIYGAKVLVYLKYDGNIKLLADKLSVGLVISNFSVEAREESPYDLVGSCEAFGFEAWLESSDKISGFAYSFKMETEHSLEESFNDKMYDLSLWLARYIFSICEIETFVSEAGKADGVHFP